MRNSLKFAGPLAGALLNGLNKLFATFETDDMIIASVSHLQFKLRWIQDEADSVRDKYLLAQAMRIFDSSHSAESAPSVDGNNFICFCDSGDNSANTIQLLRTRAFLG